MTEAAVTPEMMVYDSIPAKNLTLDSVIVEFDRRKPHFFRVLEFSEKGHEVHVKVQKLNEKGTLNWCYQSEARVYVQ